MKTSGSAVVTVIICAYTEQRWPLLRHTLTALAGQTRQADEVLIVIDHDELFRQRVQAATPRLAVLANRHAAGVAGARNTGILAARGEVLVFLDDDAVPNKTWLEQLLRPYGDPRVVGVGGVSLPQWERQCPGWFPPAFHWTVGCNRPGEITALQPVRNLWGANMSLRRTTLEQVGLFSTALGRRGTRPDGCEETELCLRIRRVMPEALLVLTPTAVVRHHVPSLRLTWRYFLARCYHEGRSKAAIGARLRHGDALRLEAAFVRQQLLRLVLPGTHRDLRRPRSFRGVLQRGATLLGIAAAIAGYLRGRLNEGVHHTGGPRFMPPLKGT